MIRQVFIDLGCYDGDSIREFLSWKQVKGLPGRPTEYEIYGFDPNPEVGEAWEKLREECPGIQLEHGAALDHDGMVDFTIRPKEAPLGSTLMPEKVDFGPIFGRVVKVKCFDFSKWLWQFAGEQVVIKMDIEGAEFPVLEKMVKNGSITVPWAIYLEWHTKKLRGDFSAREKALKEFFARAGVVVRPWD